MSKIPIRKAAEKLLAAKTKHDQEFGGYKKHYRPFSDRKPYYGIIEVDTEFYGVETVAGFVIVDGNGDNLDMRVRYRRRFVDRQEQVVEMCQYIGEQSYHLSANPLAFLMTLGRLPMDSQRYWSTPFITYQVDIRTIVDTMVRMCFGKNQVPKSLFFA